MGEIVQRTFGDKINYDDLADPMVARLRSLEGAPNRWRASLYGAARDFDWSRQRVFNVLRHIDAKDATLGLIPGTVSYEHRQWLDSQKLGTADVPSVGTQTHEAAEEMLNVDTGRVLRFPSAPAPAPNSLPPAG